MDSFMQACVEIVGEIKKNNIMTQRELNQVKLRILNRHKANGSPVHIPKNADLYFAAPEGERESL